jgi:hypothetical protein
MEKFQEPTYCWNVKIDESLHKPVAIIALDRRKEIRQIVSDAVRTYITQAEAKGHE